MKKLEKLTKKQEQLMYEVRDEWIDIALHQGPEIDKEECEAGVKWLYYASNLQEPKVVFVKGPQDFAKKFGDSVWDSVGASVGASVWDSVWDSVGASVRDSVWDSVGWTCQSGDAEFGAWYEYWEKIKAIQPQEKADKYIGYLRSGAFYVFFFEKVVFIMERPIEVYQDDQKRLHSIEHPAMEWRDGTKLYHINGVSFEEKLWKKISQDKLTAQEVFAIKNTEQRRIAYELMDKLKMKELKNYEVLDHRKKDEQGNMDEIVQFSIEDFNEPFIYYHCECPSTGRRYFIQTKEKRCVDAKNASFGLEDVEWIKEW